MERLKAREKQGEEKCKTLRSTTEYSAHQATLLYDSNIIMNKTGRVFCETLKQFVPLRVKSIKAWNQRRGRDAAQRSHGSQGAPQDVTGQKTLHQGLPPFLPPFLLTLLLSPYPAITELSPLITFFSLLSPPPHTPFITDALSSSAHIFHLLAFCLLQYKFSFFILPPSSRPLVATLASPKKIKCICNVLMYELDLLFGPVCVCVCVFVAVLCSTSQSKRATP